jgi:hypothetical protein
MAVMHSQYLLAGRMVYFRYNLPITDEIATTKQFCLTQGDAPWNTSSFSDQVADKFYQQVIDTENYNASSTNLPDTSTAQANQNNSKLSFYDPSYLLANNLKCKPAHLVFYTDTVQYTNINYTVPTNTDPTILKLYVVQSIMKNCHLIFHLDQMRSYRIH